MKLTSKIGRVLSGKAFREKGREARRRNLMKDVCRRRTFESLEDRQLLDAASLYETLPSEITIAEPDSYHYAYEGTPNDFVDTSSVDGLSASFVEGTQVAFTVTKTTTDGAVSTLGEVVIQLFSSDGEAPNSSSHFVSLIYGDYYEGKTIHRIYKGFMFQGGSSDGYGYEGSGTTIADEHSDLLTHSSRCIVAYANKGADTSDAQFYITFDAASWLDGSYNVFGFVVDGYDVIEELENATVTTNPKTGEASYPTDTYTISNMRVLADDDVNQSALRIVAEKGDDGKVVSGVSTISFSSNAADDSLEFQTTTVYSGAEGLSEYVKKSLDETNFEFTAGETVEVNLPEEFGGLDVTYTITPASEPDGYSIVSANDANSSFSIVSTASAGQYATFTVDAKLSNGLTASLTKTMYISPSTPEAELVSTDVTSVGTLEGGVYVISSDLAKSALTINVSFSAIDSGAATEAPISVFVDDTEYAYTVESHTYDEETRVASYVLNLQIGDKDALEDGLHTIKVREYIPVDRVTSHERLYSEFVNFSVMVDTESLAIVNEDTTIDIKSGESGVLQLLTNKADDSGVNRADVKFTLTNPTAGPSFISLTEDGALSWADVDENDYGVYYVNVTATDALGNTATQKFTLNVGFVPVLDDLTGLETATGKTFAAKISASVPSSGKVTIEYKLVGDDIPDGMTLNSKTGDLLWNVPDDYIDDSAIQSQVYTFTVEATSKIEQEDGTSVDGYSAQKSYNIAIANSNYDKEVAVTPVWSDIPARTVVAGNSFEYKATATVDDSAYSVIYELVNAPEGMTIDANTGKISWNVPADYFQSDAVPYESLDVVVKATAAKVLSDSSVNYGGSVETTFELSVTNPDYVDYAPAFEDLSSYNATTGKTFTADVVAKDPNGLADRVALELVGDNYPESLKFDAETGKLTWDVPSDYLDSSTYPISYQEIQIKFKATEQFKEADGSYTDGLTSEKFYTIYVANASYDKDSAVAPTWNEIADQTVVAGETFELTVSATAKVKKDSATDQDKTESDTNTGEDAEKEEYVDLDVAYFLTGDYPEGMTIDSETGKISWDVPEDYFTENVRSTTLKINLEATTIVSTTDDSVNYGESSYTSFKLTVTNPNYKTSAPVFAELDNAIASTGSAYTGTISASDPDGEADRIAYELVGDNYPKGFTFDAETGKVTWEIPEDYLASNITAQVFKFTIKATEQFKSENDSSVYTDGESTEQTFEIMIANSAYESADSVAPVFEEIDSQTVATGEKFSLTVKATATQKVEEKTTDSEGKETTTTKTVEYKVEYALTGDYPEGMTINTETGEISWDVPEDYFSSVSKKSEDLTITVQAKTIISSDDDSTEYGAATATNFTLTVTNSKYEPGVYSDWNEWFDAWVENEQTRNNGHSANLATYLSEYLAAVDARTESLAKAKSEYVSGKKSITEFIKERETIVNDFNTATATARQTLAEADEKVEQDYADQLERLNDSYKDLAENTELTKPEKVKEDAIKAAKENVKKDVEKSVGNSKFRLSNSSSGAKVATDLTSVLKLWREGYSYSTVYDEVYSDSAFTESLDSTTGDKTDSTTGDKTDSTTGDKTDSSTGDKTDSSTGDKTDSSTGDKTDSSTGDKTDSTTDDKTDSTTGDTTAKSEDEE